MEFVDCAISQSCRDWIIVASTKRLMGFSPYFMAPLCGLGQVYPVGSS